jgi:hypothetical protein
MRQQGCTTLRKSTAGIAEALHKETSAYWIDRFERHDVLCAPVKSSEELV